MALKGIEMVPAMMVIVTMLWAGVTAQSGCTTAIISLSPCLNYITGNTTTPSPSCCSQLSTVVRSQAQCLCTILNGGGSSLGIPINQTQALALPSACNVQTPPVSQCNTAGGPANSPPAGTPASPSTPSTPSVPSNPSPTPTTPSVPSVPTGDGSKTTPSGVGGSSDGSSTKLSLTLLFSLLFMASYTSILSNFF